MLYSIVLLLLDVRCSIAQVQLFCFHMNPWSLFSELKILQTQKKNPKLSSFDITEYPALCSLWPSFYKSTEVNWRHTSATLFLQLFKMLLQISHIGCHLLFESCLLSHQAAGTNITNIKHVGYWCCENVVRVHASTQYRTAWWRQTFICVHSLVRHSNWFGISGRNHETDSRSSDFMSSWIFHIPFRPVVTE